MVPVNVMVVVVVVVGGLVIPVVRTSINKLLKSTSLNLVSESSVEVTSVVDATVFASGMADETGTLLCKAQSDLMNPFGPTHVFDTEENSSVSGQF